MLDAAAAAPPVPGHGQTALALCWDGNPAVSTSLHTFRRAPWPAVLAEILLDTQSLGTFEQAPVPAATRLVQTPAWLFSHPACAIGSPP